MVIISDSQSYLVEYAQQSAKKCRMLETGVLYSIHTRVTSKLSFPVQIIISFAFESFAEAFTLLLTQDHTVGL